MAFTSTSGRTGVTTKQANSSSPDIRITHSESPLDTFVKRASSKKYHSPRLNQAKGQHTPQPIFWEPYRAQNLQHSPSQHQQQHPYSNQGSPSFSSNAGHAVSSSGRSPSTNSITQQRKLPHGNPNLYLTIDHITRTPIASNTLPSPLLHSHFPEYRDSVASGNSYYDDSFDAGSHIAEPPSPSPYDGIDRYDNASWRPEYGAGDGVTRGTSLDVTDNASTHPMDDAAEPPLKDRTIRASDFVDFYTSQPEDGEGEDEPSLPAVIVSSVEDTSMVRGGRAPVVKPVLANFSRPVRESGQWRQADALAERVTPQLPPDMREQKKAVLERNALRKSGAPQTHYTPSPLSKGMTTSSSAQSSNAFALSPMSNSFITGTQPRNLASANYNGPSSYLAPSTLHSPNHPQHLEDMQRPTSTPSIYSTYSYYQYNGLIPSPVPGRSRTPDRVLTPRAQTPSENRGSPDRNFGPPTALDYLQLGIESHEANRLKESLDYFHRSATEGGGCGVGMLMYGLSLRHGWGCKKNEQMGFKWVRKAAESAVSDLEKLRTGQTSIDQSSVQAELVLAIYEVGQCFFHGWGVAKDHKMGVSYYMVAARLGDGDAQGDLAFCLANGKGCKKNKKEAARWYRAAVKQGQSDVGLAWIYKEKYQ